MKPPFDKWDMTEAEGILAEAMERHRERGMIEAKALDDALLARPNLVKPVDLHQKPWRLFFREAFPTWDDFLAAIRSDAHPGALEVALRILSKVAPEEVLPIARVILRAEPWIEMTSDVAGALGRVDHPAAVELALAHIDWGYVGGGVASSICARAWPIVLERLRASPILDTSKTHPRKETSRTEPLIAFFGKNRTPDAWPLLARLHTESPDEYVVLPTGHALFAFGDDKSLELLKAGIDARSEWRRFFAAKAYFALGASEALEALGGLDALRKDSGRVRARELMDQAWKAASGTKEPIADERYVELALSWMKDKRMLGSCRYVLDYAGKARVASVKKRLAKEGKAPKPKKAAPIPKEKESEVRRAMATARKNLEKIVKELGKLGYRFSSKKPLGKPASKKTLASLEKAVGGPLPLSLKLAWEVIGSCDLTGVFPGEREDLKSDAFVLTDAKAILEEARENAGGEAPWELGFAPDIVGKAGFSGGVESMIVPDASVDAKVRGVKGEPLLLDRLRQVFEFGGFPGLSKARGELGAMLEKLAEACEEL